MKITYIMNLSMAGLALAVVFTASAAQAQWSTQWQLGAPVRGWPLDGTGGGPDVDYVAESGVNPPPGDPNSPAVHREADDDYYFAGTYPGPIGAVANDEIAMERAFAGTDNNLRIHFNLPSTLADDDKFRFSFEAWNLEGGLTDPHYGVSVSFNGSEIHPVQVISPADLQSVITTIEFTAADVGAIGGPGGDNIIELRGLNHNSDDGGGRWMGMDYQQLEYQVAIPEPTTISLLALASLLLLPLTRRKRSH